MNNTFLQFVSMAQEAPSIRITMPEFDLESNVATCEAMPSPTCHPHNPVLRFTVAADGNREKITIVMTEENIDGGNWTDGAFVSRDQAGFYLELEFELAIQTIEPNAISEKVRQFLNLASAAKHIVITIPGSQIDHALATFTFSEATGEPINQVLRLAVNKNGWHAVVLTEEGLATGKWQGNTFYCEDSEGSAIQLQLLALSFIVPEANDESLDAGVNAIPKRDAVIELLGTLKDATENLDAETEILWRLLVSSVQQLDAPQLIALLDNVLARLDDTEDDTVDLLTMSLNDAQQAVQQLRQVGHI